MLAVIISKWWDFCFHLCCLSVSSSPVMNEPISWKNWFGVCVVSMASSHPLKGTECSFSWEQNQNKPWKPVFIRWGQQPPGEQPLPVKPVKRGPQGCCLLWGREAPTGLGWEAFAFSENQPEESAPFSPSLHLGTSVLRREDSLMMPRWEGGRDFLSQPPSSYTAEQMVLRGMQCWIWGLAACRLCFV